jgi:hypothetical protein
MCSMLGVKKGGVYHTCDSVGELRAFVEPVFEGYMDAGEVHDDDCLCHVDARATAKKAGLRCRYTFNSKTLWHMDYVIYMPEAADERR